MFMLAFKYFSAVLKSPARETPGTRTVQSATALRGHHCGIPDNSKKRLRTSNVCTRARLYICLAGM